MYSLKASTKASTAALRSAQKVSAPLRPGFNGVSPRLITVHAEETTSKTTSTPAAEVDYSVQAQEALTKGAAYVQTVWDDTADAEKPAIVAIILASVVAQIAIGATMDAVDRLPFFGDFFELVGLAVAGAYIYRYVTDPSERASAKASIDGVVSAVTGKK